MWWQYVKGFRSAPMGLADYLPWGTLLDNDVILGKDESLLSTWHVVPHDQDSASPAEQGALMGRLNLAWTHLDAGWGVWQEVHQHRPTLPPPRTSAHRLATRIEADHRRATDPHLWTQDVYVSLWHGSLSYQQEILKKLALPMLEPDTEHSLAAFRDGTAGVIDLLAAGTERVTALTDDAWATYLHGCVSDEDGYTRMPEYAHGLDYALADCDLLPGWYPRLMRDESTGVYLGLLSLRSFPAALEANTLAGLFALPFGFRVVSRWLPQDLRRVESQLTRRQRNLSAKETGLRDAIGEWLLSRPSTRKNRFLEAQVDDTDLARFEALKEDIAFGEMSFTVVLADPDVAVVQQQRREVERVLRIKGLVPRREWVNPVGAYLSTLPGVALLNPRKWRVSSLNWLHLSPMHAPSLGQPTTSRRVTRQALTLARTATCHPYWLSLFSDDVGHTLVAGPSGSGKSTLMKFLAAQWFMLDSALPPQLFWFDWKRSARLFILCMGGVYHDLGRDAIRFQPLRDIDDLHARAEAFTWLCDRVRESSDTLTGIMEEVLQEALRRLAQVPKAQRTLSEFVLVTQQQSRSLQLNAPPTSVHPETGARDNRLRDDALTQHKILRRVLHPYLRGEIYGHLFDAETDDITEGAIHAFELEALMKTPQLLVASLAHIWSRLYRRFTGVPTVIPIDEAGEQLKYPVVRGWVDRGLRMLREKQVVIMLATQHTRDFLDSEIAPMLRGCPHLMFLPNANAMAEDLANRPAYEAMGLGVDEIRQWVAKATPMRDVYDVSPHHRRLLHLPMSPLAASICAPSSPEVHDRIDALLERHGPEDFAASWLRECGHLEEAKA